jgi:O-antigen ligase
VHRLTRLLRDHPWATDLAVVVVLAVPGLFAALGAHRGWVPVVVLAVLVLPLLGRRRHPGLMALIVLGAAWAGVLAGV